jgi:hypothetical protein
MTLKIVNSDDPEWAFNYEQLNKSQHDVFFHPGFAQTCQNSLYKRHLVKCAIWNCKKGTILYPFVQRNFLKSSCVDITGLYGRGGIAQDVDDNDELNAFHAAFRKYCLEVGVICSFDRFHPKLKNHLSVDKSSKLYNIGDFVVLNLKESIDQIESQYKHNHRKSIKKAERKNVTFFYEENLNHIDDFLTIYKRTLKRNNANNFYYFEAKFFQEIKKNLSDKFVFYYAVVDNKIISCELVLLDILYAHSFLGGTLIDFMPYGANVFLKREIIRDLKKRNVLYYLLGGGVNKNDGIYKYKLCFAPSGSHTSYIGGVIYDEKPYNDLKKYMDSQNISYDSNRIQFYDYLVDF